MCMVNHWHRVPVKVWQILDTREKEDVSRSQMTEENITFASTLKKKRVSVILRGKATGVTTSTHVTAILEKSAA